MEASKIFAMNISTSIAQAKVSVSKDATMWSTKLPTLIVILITFDRIYQREL
jgi:hypothetical protein